MALEEAKKEVAAATQTQRVITIVSTVGEKKVKVAFDGTEWGDLKKILERGGNNLEGGKFSGYSLDKMKCVESTRRGTLEHPKALLPEGDFNLFLMPVKSKSGGLSRSEVYSKIKEFVSQDADKAKAHFNADKNYTTKSTDVLIELVESYKPGTKKAIDKQKSSAIADVVSSVKAAKVENNPDEVLASLAGLSLEEKLDVVIQLLLGIKSDTVAAAPTSTEEVAKASIPAGPTPQELENQRRAKEEQDAKDAEEKEKQRLQKIEDDKLSNEMSDLMGGFDDVKR